jgi:hypothetical protein
MIAHHNGIENYKDKLRKVFWLLLNFFEHGEHGVGIFLGIVHVQNWMQHESSRRQEVIMMLLRIIDEG